MKSETTTGLKEYLNKVDNIFNIDDLLDREITSEDVIDYYSSSKYGYRFFHSARGSIHMALNFDGEFDREGYYGQARLVNKHIRQLNAKRVLEVASGTGFSLLYLATLNADVQFAGVDLTPDYVRIAKRNARSTPNVSFSVGDFQSLSFDSAVFDLLFVVESICHANDMCLALSEAFRVLKPRGRLVVFDGFRKPEFERLDPDIKLAARLVEVAMTVGHPWAIDNWLELAESLGFEVVAVQDLSEAIMPNLIRLQLLARGYFKYPFLSKIMLRLLPADLVANAIAGLLMRFTVQAGAQRYFGIIIDRPEGSGD